MQLTKKEEVQSRMKKRLFELAREEWTIKGRCIGIEGSTSHDCVCFTPVRNTILATPEDTTNARVIAAAPELLRIVIEALSSDLRFFTESGIDFSEVAFKSYLDVIEKATGIRPQLQQNENESWWEHPMIQGR